MKMNFLTAVALILLSSSISFVTPASASERLLSCDLIDLTTGRILDRSAAPTSADSPTPILLLLGYGEMMGSVRDFKAVKPGERQLELSLSYRSGMSHGEARSFANYRPDQGITADPISEAALEEPTFGKLIALRCYLVETVFAPASTTSYENGSGSASGYCDGNSSWYCYDQLKRRAKDDASRQAEWNCTMRRGKPDFFASCGLETCTPFSLPQDAPLQFVSCRSQCSVRCEIP